MEYYQPHLIVKYMVYFLLVWFFIILLSKKNRKTNVVLFAMYLINSFWFKEIKAEFDTVEYINEYIINKEFIAGIDVFLGLVIYALNKDNLTKYVWRQWGILAFVVTCHSMILYDLTISQSWLTGKFYTYYDELIIIAGLLQVWVSRDGILTSIRRVQSFDYNVWVRDIYSSKVHFPSKKRKG